VSWHVPITRKCLEKLSWSLPQGMSCADTLSRRDQDSFSKHLRAIGACQDTRAHSGVFFLIDSEANCSKEYHRCRQAHRLQRI
jgi:hypothetical protein